MSELLVQATKKKPHKFESYILDIRFPFFKKLKLNSCIEFNCPFTALVGANGSGKSSVLQALYGSPWRKSVGDFWFSTDLDPILESGDDINRFIYRYRVDGFTEEIEILKTRAQRKRSSTRLANPDYWETREANEKDLMSPVPPYSEKYEPVMTPEGRWRPIKKNVLYIDFRSELSAFDKFFYFGEFTKTKTLAKKQDYLRKYARILAQHISSPKSKFPIFWGQGKSKRSKSLYELTEIELHWVNRILNKNYSNAKVVEHNLFKNEGYSIIFKEDGHSYSEAVAGSGEVSIVNFVCRTLSAQKNSIILLDEPEVSLHPGAQLELRELLFHVILENDCQVVMATHSEHFLKELPPKAIKLFYQDQATKRYNILNECTPEQVFSRLGATPNEKQHIYVEDILAKKVVEEALKEIDSTALSRFDVLTYPGGGDTIKKQLPVHFAATDDHRRDIVFLDGDKRKSVEKRDSKRFQTEIDEGKLVIKRRRHEIPDSEHRDLNKILSEQIGIKGSTFDLPINGGNRPAVDKDKEEIELKLKVLDQYHDKFFFMNVDDPEILIWDISDGNFPLAISTIKEKTNEIDIVLLSNETDSKAKFRIASQIHHSIEKASSEDILATQIKFLQQRNIRHESWLEFKQDLANSIKLVDIE